MYLFRGVQTLFVLMAGAERELGVHPQREPSFWGAQLSRNGMQVGNSFGDQV